MDIRKQIFPLIMKTTMFYWFLIITVNKRFATENRNIPRPMLVNIWLSNFCLYWYSVQMCDLMCRRYNGRGGCGHTYSIGIQRCQSSMQRPDQSYCLPTSGKLRDLPRVVDVQDDSQDGRCPACLGQTPPSSEGSEFGAVFAWAAPFWLLFFFRDRAAGCGGNVKGVNYR